jgi:hypothetical protein
VKEFILQLEGLFRCLGGGVERTTPSIVDAVYSMEAERGGNIKALDSWIDAAIFMKQAQRARRLQQFDEDGEEQAGGIGIANAGGWAQSIATAL